MNYRQSWQSAVVITILSLFAQTLNWFAFDKLNYHIAFTFLTPIILCVMYHLVQADTGHGEGFTRRFFFLFSSAVPFCFGMVLTIVMLLLNPGLSTFSPDTEYTGTAAEIISVYAGRFMFTSLYLAVFAVIDIPLLRLSDSKRTKK